MQIRDLRSFTRISGVLGAVYIENIDSPAGCLGILCAPMTKIVQILRFPSYFEAVWRTGTSDALCAANVQNRHFLCLLQGFGGPQT